MLTLTKQLTRLGHGLTLAFHTLFLYNKCPSFYNMDYHTFPLLLYQCSGRQKLRKESLLTCSPSSGQRPHGIICMYPYDPWILQVKLPKVWSFDPLIQVNYCTIDDDIENGFNYCIKLWVIKHMHKVFRSSLALLIKLSHMARVHIGVAFGLGLCGELDLGLPLT